MIIMCFYNYASICEWICMFKCMNLNTKRNLKSVVKFYYNHVSYRTQSSLLYKETLH